MSKQLIFSPKPGQGTAMIVLVTSTEQEYIYQDMHSLARLALEGHFTMKGAVERHHANMINRLGERGRIIANGAVRFKIVDSIE